MSNPGVVKWYNPDTQLWESVFVGRRGTAGVVKSATPPSDQEVLWVDTSETASFGAPILSSWDSVRNDPGGTTTNYGWPKPADADIVKDGAQVVRNLADAVDAEVRRVEDYVEQYAGGHVAYNSSDSSVLGIGTEAVEILAVTASLLAGRRYVLEGHTRYNGDDSAGGLIVVSLEWDSAPDTTRALFSQRTESTGASAWQSCYLRSNNEYVPAANETMTARMFASRTGSGTVRTNASSAAPCWIRVLDIGPA